MIRAIFLFFLTLLATLPLSGKGKRQETAILFIGNSYTFVNNLPELFASLAEKNGHELRVESYTKGAASLMEFMCDPAHARCRELVKNGGFDYVVLQDQSQMPCLSPERTLTYGKQWCELARSAGAKPVLFITWAHAQATSKGHFEPQVGMQDGLTTTYCQLARETGARVAPVGEAWRRWHHQFPDTPLHDQDGSHPNALGSYLAACVLYGAILRESPVGLPTRARAGKRPLRLSGSLARDARQIAASTLRGFSAAKYLEKRAEADASHPTLEELMPLLQPGATMEPLKKKLGKPTMKQGSTICYPLRGGMLLHLTPGEEDKVRQAIITTSNGTTRAILLQP